jgi:hypothetical protein
MMVQNESGILIKPEKLEAPSVTILYGKVTYKVVWRCDFNND